LTKYRSFILMLNKYNAIYIILDTIISEKDENIFFFYSDNMYYVAP